jgi:malate dehydrogenase
LLNVLNGSQSCAYLRWSWFQVTELPFFASKVRLGRGGAEEILPLGPLNDFERCSSSTLFVT